MMRIKRTSLVVALVLVGMLAAARTQAEEPARDDDSKQLYLRGMDLWGKYCANCHNAPPGSDRAPHEWDTIALHMRTRANLPAESARAIFEYLRAR